MMHLVLIMALAASFILTQAQEKSKIESENNNKIKMTTAGYGGQGILFTSINGQSVIMTGGKGAATFNKRYTIGGAGWGTIKGVEIPYLKKDTFEFFKFGYGGLDLGYVINPNDKILFGANLLIGCGAGFTESLPKAETNGFEFFPVLEPTIYLHIPMGNILRFDIGLSYRMTTNVDFSYVSSKEMRGLSCYVAILIGNCVCNL